MKFFPSRVLFRTRLLITCILIFQVTAFSQIQVSANHRFLQLKDGSPFFWMGDTDWEMVHRLTREEVTEFVETRREQGFNVLQVVALAEFNGIREPNRYGDYPLNREDPTDFITTPGNNPNDNYEYDYWDHLDFVINKAAEKGMYVGLLPTWGDKVAHMWGDGPRIFKVQNAEEYAGTLAIRYAKKWNVLWILGGDRPSVYKAVVDGAEKEFDDRPIWGAMAKGIETILGPEAFITYHPTAGPIRSSTHLQNEPWLDMNAFQSGHGTREADPWHWVAGDLALKPAKPTLDMEPCYEDHPVNPWDGQWTRQRGYFSAYDVRARIYRSVFAGGCGVTYGHHQVWQFLNTDLYKPINVGDTLIPWKRAMRAEAAGEMKHLKNLMLSRPYFNRVMDLSIVVSDAGGTYVDQIMATRDESRSYAMIYLPQNVPVEVDLSKISGHAKNAWWYDPRTGKATAIKSPGNKGTKVFTPPKEGKDWVLVVDDAVRKFKVPGNP